MHVRVAFALLSLFACTPATPPVERAAEVVEAAPPVPAKVEPELPIGDAKPPTKPIEPAPAVEPAAVEPAAVEPAPPLVEGKPLVAAKRYPDNVYGVLADSEVWAVDIIDFDYVEGSAAARALEGGDERLIDEVAPDSPVMPKGWAIGDDWILVTRTGTVPKKSEGFAAYISDGSGVLHFKVRLGKRPRGAAGPALAIRGRTGEHIPTLSKAEPVALTVLGDDALAKITTAISAKLDTDQRKSLRKHPLKAKHVGVFAGRFPGDRSHAIIVRMVPGNDDAPVSGVLFAKQDGTIELVTISDVWGQIELFAIGDLDGDGTDELVYEDAYHEGWYLQLLHWKQDKPKIRTLTGDGV